MGIVLVLLIGNYIISASGSVLFTNMKISSTNCLEGNWDILTAMWGVVLKILQTTPLTCSNSAQQRH